MIDVVLKLLAVFVLTFMIRFIITTCVGLYVIYSLNSDFLPPIPSFNNRATIADIGDIPDIADYDDDWD